MQRLSKVLFLTVLASETTHVFCCVLPVLVSLLSLLTSMGLISAQPTGLNIFHDFMHSYELPLITFSTAMLGLGWGLYRLSTKLDCQTDAGCHHKPCAPKKDKTLLILKIATALFTFNMLVYLILHSPWGVLS